MIARQIVDQRGALEPRRTQQRKQYLFLCAKVSDKIAAVKRQHFLGALTQTCRTHGFDLPQRLLAAAQREG